LQKWSVSVFVGVVISMPLNAYTDAYRLPMWDGF